MKTIIALLAIIGMITISDASPIAIWTKTVPLITTLTIFLAGGYMPMIFAGWVKRESKRK